MKHLSPVNAKARLLAEAAAKAEADVVALDDHQGTPQQPSGPHIPLGCSTIWPPLASSS